MNENDDKNWYWLKEKTKSAFVSTSSNYKQKILYNLLNATKVGDQKRFFDILYRAMAANLENSKELAEKISELQSKTNKPQDFEKFSYSIILGIMVSKNKQGGN